MDVPLPSPQQIRIDSADASPTLQEKEKSAPKVSKECKEGQSMRKGKGPRKGAHRFKKEIQCMPIMPVEDELVSA